MLKHFLVPNAMPKQLVSVSSTSCLAQQEGFTSTDERTGRARLPYNRGAVSGCWCIYLLCQHHTVIRCIFEAGIECIELMTGAVHTVPGPRVKLDEGSGQWSIQRPGFVSHPRFGANQVEASACCV